MRCIWAVIAVPVLFLSACAKKEAPAAPSPETHLGYIPNGWTDAERVEYYHLPEGSELMPYALLANLNSTATGKPFLQNMERFGFVPDTVSESNPHGLPIGITVVHSRNLVLGGIEMVGFNCAACHVGEIAHGGKHLRIDGAPSLINLQAYQVEFKNSLDATLKDPKKLLKLVIAIDREQHSADSPDPDAAVKYTSEPAVKNAADVPAAPIADPNFHSLPPKAADALPGGGPAAGKSFPERLKSHIAILKARLAYVKNGKLLVDGTEPGPGRVDAFGAARNLLFPAAAMKMQSPVSFPFIWGVPDTTEQRSSSAEKRWIHYDGNTNSILERNIGQALGMGAVFDPKTYESTLRIGNLHRLEVLTHKLQPPKWPADLLGALDETKAKTGEQIFKDKCESCHQNQLYSLAEIGTDPTRAGSFGQPVMGKPFPAAIAPILAGLKKRAFQDEGISEADQATMDANPVVWRAPGQYMARPLKGIWATAPYLHNGSVPTLYHLLHPDQRPAKFPVGVREYDPAKLGYVTETAASGAWIFDTSQPGNGSGGHSGEKFGTTLPEDQKAALLEYLKTI